MSDPSLSLVASYDGPYDEVGFTVIAYSSSPISWKTELNALAYNEKVRKAGRIHLPFLNMFQATGAFISKNAGGNPALPTFMVNPQYHLRIHPDSAVPKAGRSKKARLKLSLQGERRIPLNVLAVWSHGQRIAEYVILFICLARENFDVREAFLKATSLSVLELTLMVMPLQ